MTLVKVASACSVVKDCGPLHIASPRDRARLCTLAANLRMISSSRELAPFGLLYVASVCAMRYSSRGLGFVSVVLDKRLCT
jgi:hypothetical protein